MDSAAWKDLPPTSIVVFLQLLKKMKGEEQCPLSYSLLRLMTGRHNKTTSRAIRALERVGFIDIKKRGGIFNGSSVYARSSRWKDFKPADKPKSKRKPPRLGNYKSRQKMTRSDPEERTSIALNDDPIESLGNGKPRHDST
jgi:hypothetical protein